MPLSVEWSGLDEMIQALKQAIPARAEAKLAELTQSVFDETLKDYVENLSGGSSSTNANPLPVGIRSGDLLAHAQADSKVIDAYSCEWRNGSEHAAPVEFGTEKMDPRAPLQEAVNKLNMGIQVKLDQTMDDIVNP